ncbi:alpha/beta fold hydrolase [Halobaculum limi]|uniref:alpha/beta fold hydrolase n=1 Tax=Halobaculum limi TaxID=3031916 RepID=UPI002404D5A6|nr:alpha/beta hydrolase [Halobaculum sp. YSMS11]
MTASDPGHPGPDGLADVPHELDLSRGPIRYHDVGEGDPVLFVHSAFADGSLWRDVAWSLPAGVRSLVPTLPLGGHDAPMRPGADLTPTGLAAHLAEFLDALGIDRVTLVGNDSGGAVSQVFLAEYPQRVERLVLTNCDAFDNFPPLGARPFIWGARVPGLVSVFARTLRSATVRRLAFRLLAKHPIRPEVLAGYTAGLRDPRVRRDLRTFLLGVSPRYTNTAAEAFSTFDGPVLVAWAPDDPIFPLADAERLVDSFADARLELVDDSYALVPEDNPERLVELLAPFLGVPVDV